MEIIDYKGKQFDLNLKSGVNEIFQASVCVYMYRQPVEVAGLQLPQDTLGAW